VDRWATFDCYGTLIDWNGGIRHELARVFGAPRAGELLARYHELEAELERDGALSYREVLTEGMRQLGAPPGEEGALAGSLRRWPPFPEVRPALDEARRRGWRLALLSNTDADYIKSSKEMIDVPFDETIVAGDISSYKPAHKHWLEFEARTGADPARHVHVAASLYHDVAPTAELGIPCIWINRLGETAAPRPARELPDLTRLPETLDELVPA
jgi:2-haloacid dehalogenase